MPANLPPRTTVTNRAGDAWNKLIANSRSHQPMASDGMLTGHTVHGTFREPEPSMPAYGAAPVATATSAIYMFKLQSLGTGADANLLRCFTWDGTTTGTTSVYILKPYKLWNHARLLIDNVDTLYSYGVDFNYRQAAYSNPPFGNVTENQIIVPRYTIPYAAHAPSGRPAHTGDIIHAGKLATAQTVNGRTIEYVDLNVDGRAWARQRVS